jgi:hypothetical protein
MSTEAFCYTSSQCSDGLAVATVTIASSSTASAGTGNYSFFWLYGDTTNSVTRQAVFSVSTAGTYTYYVRGAANDDDVGFYRRQLTLMYIPH